jgi:hypothetical protein
MHFNLENWIRRISTHIQRISTQHFKPRKLTAKNSQNQPKIRVRVGEDLGRRGWRGQSRSGSRRGSGWSPR